LVKNLGAKKEDVSCRSLSDWKCKTERGWVDEPKIT
jgi:hypothetical protein